MGSYIRTSYCKYSESFDRFYFALALLWENTDSSAFTSIASRLVIFFQSLTSVKYNWPDCMSKHSVRSYFLSGSHRKIIIAIQTATFITACSTKLYIPELQILHVSSSAIVNLCISHQFHKSQRIALHTARNIDHCCYYTAKCTSSWIEILIIPIIR